MPYKNIEDRRKNLRERRAQNPEKRRRYERELYAKTRTGRRRYARNWRKSNLDKIREYGAKWRKKMNRPKQYAASRAWMKNHPQRVRRYWRKSMYGIGPSDFASMRKTQRARCKICDQPFGKNQPCIDHDHATGQVRGLLCRACNVGLGTFRDSVKNLRSAIEYLETHSVKTNQQK